jgi:hypothetical protein
MRVTIVKNAMSGRMKKGDEPCTPKLRGWRRESPVQKEEQPQNRTESLKNGSVKNPAEKRFRSVYGKTFLQTGWRGAPNRLRRPILISDFLLLPFNEAKRERDQIPHKFGDRLGEGGK